MGGHAGRMVEVWGDRHNKPDQLRQDKLCMARRPCGSLVTGRWVLAHVVLLGGSEKVKLSTSLAASRLLQLLHDLGETKRR